MLSGTVILWQGMTFWSSLRISHRKTSISAVTGMRLNLMRPSLESWGSKNPPPCVKVAIIKETGRQNRLPQNMLDFFNIYYFESIIQNSISSLSITTPGNHLAQASRVTTWIIPPPECILLYYWHIPGVILRPICDLPIVSTDLDKALTERVPSLDIHGVE